MSFSIKIGDKIIKAIETDKLNWVCGTLELKGEDADSLIFSLNNIDIGVLKNTEDAKQMLKLVGKWVKFNKETLKTAEQKDK